MSKSLSFFFLFFLGSYTFAQQLPANFEKATAALQAKDYAAALEGYKGFLDPNIYGVLSFYASFHGAEAALKLGQTTQAIDLLSALQGKTGEKSDELNYLLSLAYFQNHQVSEALAVLATLKTPEYSAKGDKASFSYLKDSSSTYLVDRLETFKQNNGYTAALGYALQQKPILTVAERTALQQLIQSGTQPALKDKVLDVVVILPFTNGAEQAISSLESGSFITELYQGIQLEVASLLQEGKAIRLHTFDSKRDLNYLTTLIKDPLLLEADAILGPIYPEESELIRTFAEAQRIPFIHPLSNLGNRFEESQFSYLFRPSVPSLSAGIVEALTIQGWGQSVALGYSGSARDEQLALLLKEQLIKKGFKMVQLQKIDPTSATSFLQSVGVKIGNRPTVDQVILLTDDPAIAQPVFALMESISTQVPLLVMDSWLGFNFSNFEMLEFSNFYFISNNTPTYHSEAMDTFRQLFYEKHLTFPGINAILGAELIDWLHSRAEFVRDYQLRDRLDQNAFQPGKLTWGFNFQQKNNNSYSPVFKLESGELIPLH